MVDVKKNQCTRREFLKASSAALLAAGLAAGGGGVAASLAAGAKGTLGKAPGARPNILFVFPDQQPWDSVGCCGHKLNITPNLDKMASQGVRFEYSFTNQPLCGPARAMVQTGKYPTEMGVYRNGITFPLDEMSLAKWLSGAGYEVGYVGKWHLAGRQGNKAGAVLPEYRAGYKDFWIASEAPEMTSTGYGGHLFDADMNPVEIKGYRVDCTTDFALKFLQTRSKDKPFFLFLSYLEPHHQNTDYRFEGPVGSKERFAKYEVPGDLVGTKGDWRENYPDYYGACNSIDQNLGRIRAELEKLGMADNTLIIYTSDHACHFKTRNNEYKRTVHEDAIRTPLVIYGPGFRGGKVIKDFAALIDIPSTILTAAGLTVPKTMRGRPLQELASGSAKNWRKDVLIQVSESHLGRGIRTEKWKYSIAAPNNSEGPIPGASFIYTEECLYDLEKDPNERNNLVSDPAYAGVRKKLADLLVRRMATEAGETAPKIVPA